MLKLYNCNDVDFNSISEYYNTNEVFPSVCTLNISDDLFSGSGNELKFQN